MRPPVRVTRHGGRHDNDTMQCTRPTILDRFPRRPISHQGCRSPHDGRGGPARSPRRRMGVPAHLPAGAPHRSELGRTPTPAIRWRPSSPISATSTTFVCATQRGAGSEHSDDAILLALVELARDDELAGRVVLQRLLAGADPARGAVPVVSRSQRPDRPGDPGGVAGDPLLRRRATAPPRRIVADLRRGVPGIPSAASASFARPSRSARRATSMPTPCHDEPATALDEFVTVLREAQSGGSAGRRPRSPPPARAGGLAGVVAQQRKVTPRTIRNHRDRAIDHVRTALAVASPRDVSGALGEVRVPLLEERAEAFLGVVEHRRARHLLHRDLYASG